MLQGKNSILECQNCGTIPIFQGVVNANVPGYGTAQAIGVTPIVCNPENVDYSKKSEFIKTDTLTTQGNQKFIVYPNPNTGRVNIKLLNANTKIKTIKISIYSVDGKLIMNKTLDSITNNIFTFDLLENMESGIYYLQIGMNWDVSTAKIYKL